MTRTGSSTLVLTIRTTKGQKTALKSIRQSFETPPIRGGGQYYQIASVAVDDKAQLETVLQFQL